MSEGFQLAANYVGRESGCEERAIDGSKFLVGHISAERTQLAFDALADDGGFIRGVSGFGNGFVDVAIGDPAGAKVSSDAVFALFADFGACARKLFGVARVVEFAAFLETGEDDLCEEFAIGAAKKLFLHFVDGMGAAHKDAQRVVVKILLVVEFARSGEHQEEE